MRGSSHLSAADTLDMRDLVAITRRRAKLILLIVATIFGGTFLYLSQMTPLYTATVLILVDPAQKDLLQPAEGESITASLASSRVESEVEILRSDAVLLALIEGKNLNRDPEFGPSLSLSDKVKQVIGIANASVDSAALLGASLTRLHKAVNVRRRGLTNVVALSFSSEDPAHAAELANALADTYVHLQVATKSNSFLDARDVLEKQLAAAQATLANSDSAFARYIDTNLDRLDRESGSGAVTALRQQLDRANAEHLSARRDAERAEMALRAQDWASLVDTLHSEAIRALDEQRQALARRLGNAEAGAGDAADLRAGLARIEAQLTAEGQAELATLRQDVAGFARSGDQLRESIRSALVSADLSSETLSQLYSLRQEANIAQRQYDTLLSRMRDLETQALIQVADSRVVSQAIAPESASYPNTKLVLALALVASSGLGVGVALLAEFYVGGIHSAGQLTNILGTRVGAVIPWVAQNPAQLSVADTIIDAPMSPYAESLRRLRASIDRFSPLSPDHSRVVMITSASAAEGKTSVALALARTYAAAGKRTLLIDADMRNPSQHLQLGADPASGLFEYLVSPADNAEAVEYYDLDPRAKVGVIFGRNRPAAPTDQLLQTDRFRDLVDDARKSFDVVIIDTPPLIPIVDARYIAPLVDCAVLCVRAEETGQSNVRTAYEQLTDHIDMGTTIVTALTFHGGSGRTALSSGDAY